MRVGRNEGRVDWLVKGRRMLRDRQSALSCDVNGSAYRATPAAKPGPRRSELGDGLADRLPSVHAGAFMRAFHRRLDLLTGSWIAKELSRHE